MNIKKELNLTSEDLTKDIRFHGETNADDEACEKISQLNDLLNDVMWDLIRTKQQTESNPKAKSSIDIRKELDEVFNTVDSLSNVYNNREELL